MREIRLGDVIDDFCIKCKRLTNHSVVSILNEQPAKVRCRTCYSDHDYRHEIAPPSKKDLKKMELFNEVLGGIAPDAVPDEGDPLEAEELVIPEEVEAVVAGIDAEAEQEPEKVIELPPPKPAKKGRVATKAKRS